MMEMEYGKHEPSKEVFEPVTIDVSDEDMERNKEGDFDSDIEACEIFVMNEFGEIEQIINGYEEEANEDERAELEKLRTLAQAAQEGVLEKISNQLGSNEGGWYEDGETGEKHYIKFYDNPDQARIEFVANAIYEKLGINSVRSQLFEMNGKLAIGSKGIEGAESAKKGEMQSNRDVQNGFIADAYLANWDVVGLVYDNVVKDAEGKMHRIDNGGTMIFRAQGGPKEFSPNNIAELDSMRNPDFTSGQVFSGLTEEQMAEQARHLAETLSDEAINQILSESGLQGPALEEIRVGLVGRRDFLIERFNLQIAETKEAERASGGRIEVTLDLLRERAEKEKDVEGMRSRIGMLADGSKIENQQIHIVDATDEGRYDVNFKLTREHNEKIKEKFRQLLKAGAVKASSIDYGSAGSKYKAVQAYELRVGQFTIKVSTGLDSYGPILAAEGLIQIEADSDNLTPEQFQSGLKNLLENFLEIPGAVEAPEDSQEKEYKLARYAWQNKLDISALTPEEIEAIESRLSREEVFPGYETMVEKGRAQELREKHGEFSTYHDIYDKNLIGKIIKAGGLLSTHERYRRGLIVNGMSSKDDMRTGGADSVFTRTLTATAAERSGRYGSTGNESPNMEGIRIIFDNSIMERTDFYAYDNDKYGTVEPSEFEDRQTPDQIFTEQASKGWYDNNEQMFRLGIPVEQMKAFAVTNETSRIQVLQSLRNEGIQEINGKPIEEFVVVIRKNYDLIDLANDRPPRSQVPEAPAPEVSPKPAPEVSPDMEIWAGEDGAYVEDEPEKSPEIEEPAPEVSPDMEIWAGEDGAYVEDEPEKSPEDEESTFFESSAEINGVKFDVGFSSADLSYVLNFPNKEGENRLLISIDSNDAKDVFEHVKSLAEQGLGTEEEIFENTKTLIKNVIGF